MLSVPNDAFWPIESPWHADDVGRGRVRGAAPAAARRPRRRQAGAAAGLLDRSRGHRRRSTRPAFTPLPDAVAVALPRRVRPARRRDRAALSAVAQTDLAEQRRWERQREANLAFYEDRIQWAQREFGEWRGYMNELETKLGQDADHRAARLPVRVAFVVNDLQLSGGVGVVVEHARQLVQRARLRRRARAGARAGRARLGLPRARRGPGARDGARPRAALRRRRRDLVGDGRPARSSSTPTATPTSCSRSRTASTCRTRRRGWPRR